MEDRVIVEKISGYIKRIYELIEHLDRQEILANIYSLFENITNEDIAKKQIEMGIWSLYVCRITSTYDYDALNWIKVKKLCKRLLSSTSEELLQECHEIALKKES